MADGFLGRWSRRKIDAKDGKPLEAEPPRPVAPPAVPAPPAALAPVATPAPEPAEPPPAPPTLDDVQSLTPASDFRRFVAPDVAPEVKNAAMKKLFADPHFNVMDGLDIYIDDYNKPDPLPESMARQLAGARFLGLFRDEERKDEDPAGTRVPTDELGGQSVAQLPPADPAPVPAPPLAAPADTPPDADPDLRLQQDDAPPGQGPGRGAG